MKLDPHGQWQTYNVESVDFSDVTIPTTAIASAVVGSSRAKTERRFNAVMSETVQNVI